MKSVKVGSVGEVASSLQAIRPVDEGLYWADHCLVRDLGIVPGCTLVCYAPGEGPEEGWETVACGNNGAKNRDAKNIRLQHGDHGEYDAIPLAVLNPGDAYRVQILRAPKPKEAVLHQWMVGIGKAAKEETFGRKCGACQFPWQEPRELSEGPDAPSRCPNCSAGFTETRDL